MFAGNVQVGAASTGDRQTTTAYTNVTEYRDWIQSLAGMPQLTGGRSARACASLGKPPLQHVHLITGV